MSTYFKSSLLSSNSYRVWRTLSLDLVGEKVLDGLVKCGYHLYNSGVGDYNNQNYDNAIKKYTEIFWIKKYLKKKQVGRPPEIGFKTKELEIYY